VLITVQDIPTNDNEYTETTAVFFVNPKKNKYILGLITGGLLQICTGTVEYFL
jgi:hypothetical protein